MTQRFFIIKHEPQSIESLPLVGRTSTRCDGALQLGEKGTMGKDERARRYLQSVTRHFAYFALEHGDMREASDAIDALDYSNPTVRRCRILINKMVEDCGGMTEMARIAREGLATMRRVESSGRLIHPGCAYKTDGYEFPNEAKRYLSILRY